MSATTRLGTVRIPATTRPPVCPPGPPASWPDAVAGRVAWSVPSEVRALADDVWEVMCSLSAGRPLATMSRPSWAASSRSQA